MMKVRYQSFELVEKIVVQTRYDVWVAFSIRGCGILAKAIIGKHDEDHMETRRTALTFASQVVRAIGLSFADERVPTPQILVDAADVSIEDTERTELICTTWQYLPEGIEVCSVGTNTVLLYEEDTIQKVIAPHNINEQLKSQGISIQERQSAPMGIPTHALTSKKSKNDSRCGVDDVRVARIPLSPTTTIAIIANWRLAEDILKRAVPRKELSSFIEAWDVFAGKQGTSVLISLAEH